MDTNNSLITDQWVATGQGRILARCWEPGTGSEEFGSRAPLILFHDSLGCIRLWRTFPVVLAEYTGRKVIAYDRLGFGESDRRTDRLSTDFVGDEARTFFPKICEQLNIERFVAFGHSVGGGMAVNCAALHASACEALVTESAQAFVDDGIRAGILHARELFQDPERFERLQRYHGAKTRWVLDAWIETWLSPEFAKWSLKDVLPQVRCPALIIHGSEDEYGSKEHAETIAKSVSGPSQLEIVPGVSHVPHREREHWAAKRVADFLKNV